MLSLENSFIRILFAVIIQIICLVTAIFGIVCAGKRKQWTGIIKFLSDISPEKVVGKHQEFFNITLTKIFSGVL